MVVDVIAAFLSMFFDNQKWMREGPRWRQVLLAMLVIVGCFVVAAVVVAAIALAVS